MKRLTGWALAGALLTLLMPIAANANPWNHHGARAAQWRALASERMAQGQYAGQYTANTNSAMMRLQQQAAMQQAYQAARAQQWAARNSYAASPYMGYAPTSGYGVPMGYAPTSGYGASPLSSLMAPILSGYAPSAAYAPAASYAPAALPSYYGNGYRGYYPGSAGYYPASGAYHPATGYFPGRNALGFEHHNLFGSATTGTPHTGTTTTTTAGRGVGALMNFIR
jgi:hypothetical protein